MIDITKPAILYVIKNTKNKFVYYGMIHKVNKTIEQRLQDHITGRGAGVFLHKAINKIGKENFYIEEIDRGPFDYISKKEKDLSSESLWIKERGYNGNSGRCILMNKEMYEKKLKNTDIEKRTAAWRKTYNNNRGKHNHTRSEQYRLKQEEINWSRYRGKTKNECKDLMIRSYNMKERCKNPTVKMLEGREKAKETRRGQNKYNCERIRKCSETRKKIKQMQEKITLLLQAIGLHPMVSMKQQMKQQNF